MENEAGRPGLPLDVVIGLGANLGDREAALRASVRELARFGGDVTNMVPPPVAKRLEEKYGS